VGGADRNGFLEAIGDRMRGIAVYALHGCPAVLIEALPRLEMIACFGIGVDAIDVAAAKSCGVRVTNTPDVLTDDTADIAVVDPGREIGTEAVKPYVVMSSGREVGEQDVVDGLGHIVAADLAGDYCDRRGAHWSRLSTRYAERAAIMDGRHHRFRIARHRWHGLAGPKGDR
jgi:hypothetical protein